MREEKIISIDSALCEPDRRSDVETYSRSRPRRARNEIVSIHVSLRRKSRTYLIPRDYRALEKQKREASGRSGYVAKSIGAASSRLRWLVSDAVPIDFNHATKPLALDKSIIASPLHRDPLSRTRHLTGNSGKQQEGVWKQSNLPACPRPSEELHQTF